MWLMLGLWGGERTAWSDSLPAAAGPQLEFTATLSKPQFEVGEPIVLTLRLVNLGADAYLIQTSTEETGALDGFVFVVTTREGEAVARAGPRLPPIKSLGSWDTLPRFGRHERQLFLNYWFEPLPPGHYTMRARYRPRTWQRVGGQDWPALEARAVDFEVRPTTGEKLGARVRRMTDEAKRGDVLALDFLAFTGAPEALGQLLESLYDDEPELQRRAANALGYLPAEARVDQAAIDTARDRGVPVVFAQWLGIRRVAPASVVPVLLSHTTATDVGLRIGALTGLRLLQESDVFRREYRTQVLKAGLVGLADAQADVRLAAVLLLGFVDDPTVTPALQELAQREHYSTVKRAVEETLRERENRESAAVSQ